MSRAQNAAETIKNGSATDMQQLRAGLAHDPVAAAAVLRELARDDAVEVRAWVTGAARSFLEGPDAVTVLELLADDRDSVVRGEALRELIDLDRGWASKAARRYQAMLGTDDVMSVVDAMWALVRLRDLTALQAIRELATKSPQRLVANNARVAALVLEGNERALLEPLEQHDHSRVAMSLDALAYLATPTAVSALEQFAENAPDPECAQRASRCLAMLDRVKPIALH